MGAATPPHYTETAQSTAGRTEIKPEISFGIASEDVGFHAVNAPNLKPTRLAVGNGDSSSVEVDAVKVSRTLKVSRELQDFVSSTRTGTIQGYDRPASVPERRCRKRGVCRDVGQVHRCRRAGRSSHQSVSATIVGAHDVWGVGNIDGVEVGG